MNDNPSRRMPPYLSRMRLPRLAWLWALLAGLVYAGLQLAVLLWYQSTTSGNRTTVVVAGLVLGSLLVAALVWWVARLLERAFDDSGRMRERLYEVIDCLPDPASVRDVKGRYVLWNRAAEQYYGLRSDYVVGKTPAELYPPAVVDQLRRMERDALTRRQPVVERLQLPPLYGNPSRLMLLRVAAVHSGDGEDKLRGIVSILHDITEEEQTAEAVRRQAAQLRLVVSASGLGTWDWNLATDKAGYSDSFLRLLRYRGEDFRRDFIFRDRLHPEDRDAVLAAVRASVEQGTPFDRRYRLRCFDGQIRRFRGCGEAVLDAWGERHFAGLLIPMDETAPPGPDGDSAPLPLA